MSFIDSISKRFSSVQVTNGVLDVNVGNSLTVGTISTVTNLANTTQITPGTALANLGKAEDAVAATGWTGVGMLGVRRDAPLVTSSATADFNELACDQHGAQLNRDIRSHMRTFSCSAQITLAATPTDVVALFGNASTKVLPLAIIITGTQTTAGHVTLNLVRRSAANTGGTSTNPGTVSSDTTDTAASSNCAFYTANPSALGTATGNVRTSRKVIGPATAVDYTVLEWDLMKFGKGQILSGVAQGIALNLGGQTVAGAVLEVTVIWAEF